jgi:hypothetical protein
MHTAAAAVAWVAWAVWICKSLMAGAGSPWLCYQMRAGFGPLFFWRPVLNPISWMGSCARAARSCWELVDYGV